MYGHLYMISLLLVAFRGLVCGSLAPHRIAQPGLQVVDTTYGSTKWLQAGDWADVMPTFQAGSLSQEFCELRLGSPLCHLVTRDLLLAWDPLGSETQRVGKLRESRGQGDSTTVRYVTDKFTGKYVTHCHKLEHEENGMSGFLRISGEEGAVWEAAQMVDPTCYWEDAPSPGYSLL